MGKSGLYFPDGDPDHSQNLMGSKLDQDSSSDFLLRKIQSVVFDNPANKQTDKLS